MRNTTPWRWMKYVNVILCISYTVLFACNIVYLIYCIIRLHLWPASSDPAVELRMQKLNSHPVRTQSLNVLPWKPGLGQHAAVHATLTARNFFLAYFYPSSPFTCIFSKTSPDFFPALAEAKTGSCVGPQNRIGHLAGCRLPCWVTTKYKQAKKK